MFDVDRPRNISREEISIGETYGNLIVALDGCGFCKEESGDGKEEALESLLEELFSGQLADIACAVCETINTIEIRQSEPAGNSDQRDTKDVTVKIKFKDSV